MMLVAVRSFVDTDGQMIEAGTTYVDESAEVARMFPANFEPAPWGSLGLGGSITRSGGPCTLVDRPRRTVSRSSEIELLETPSVAPFTITVRPEARRAIEEEVAWCSPNGGAFPDRGWRESGGVLYANARSRFDRVEVVLASGPGPYSRHALDAFQRSSTEDIERQLFGAYRPRHLFHRIGSWHSHPVPDDRPSQADMEAWITRSKETEGMSYVSVIVTPADSGGWMFPQLSGWVVRHDGARYICERTRVVES
jgi:hypothetical protein